MTRANRSGLAQFVGTPPTMALLHSLPFLDGLPMDEVAALLQSNSLVVDFAAGDQLTRQDDDAEFVFFILSGSVRVSRCDTGQAADNAAAVEALTRVVGAGHLIGRYELTFSLKYISAGTPPKMPLPCCASNDPRWNGSSIVTPPPASKRPTRQVVNRLRAMPLLGRCRYGHPGIPGRRDSKPDSGGRYRSLYPEPVPGYPISYSRRDR